MKNIPFLIFVIVFVKLYLELNNTSPFKNIVPSSKMNTLLSLFYANKHNS